MPRGTVDKQEEDVMHKCTVRFCQTRLCFVRTFARKICLVNPLDTSSLVTKREGGRRRILRGATFNAMRIQLGQRHLANTFYEQYDVFHVSGIYISERVRHDVGAT